MDAWDLIERGEKYSAELKDRMGRERVGGVLEKRWFGHVQRKENKD